MDGPLNALVWFYNQRAGAENLIKEANNDAGLAAHPSNRWMMNANWFQITLLAQHRCSTDHAPAVCSGYQR